MKKPLRRIMGALLACAMAFPAAGDTLPSLLETTEAAAATTNYNFDFGGSGTASGYTGVSASTGYSSSTGYGFANTSGVKDVTAAGSGALSDAVQFTDTTWTNTFNVDLPNGLYRITVTLGNTNRTSVVAEDVLQIINMTGNNAVDSILIPITDGQLNIMATNGKEGYAHTMSALQIEWVSDDTVLPPTIWMCGDSTVCNYYPKDTSTQAGWGQVLDQYVDDSWQVRNMAASGQYAAGFVNGGQFDPILKYGKEGDLYIISIGINDTNYSNEEEYTTVVTSMVQQAKAKGMEVVLVKQQGRASDVNRDPLLGGRWFSGALETIAAAENVQIIDLFTPWQEENVAMGYEATLTYYMTDDDLHPNRAGAERLAQYAVDQINWNFTLEEGVVINENSCFMLKNVNSGLYLSLADTPADGTDVVQAANTGIDEGYSLWRAQADADGYYKIYSMADETKLLDVASAGVDNGTNIGIWGNTSHDAQSFKFVDNGDGSYTLVTKVTSDKSAVGIAGGSLDAGTTAIEWEIDGTSNQKWVLEYAHKTETDVTLGDLNDDGVINVFDEAILKKMLSGAESTRRQKRSADADADRAVSASDAVMVQDFILNRGGITPVETGNRVYYAVDQAYAAGAEENTNAGFVSDAYLNLHNQLGSFIEWKVTVPADGNYLCTFYVANGSANDRGMKIEVNNGTDYWIQPFLTTSAWTTWQERAIVLPLTAGENIIRTTSNTAEGAPNIDYLRLEATDEPIAEIYTPPVELPPTEDGRMIYIAGDSTVQTYKASYAPQQGWGCYLGDYLSDEVTVSNHAIAGRSSKSFYDQGRLQSILDVIEEGDYLLVQFGINDSAYNNEERYAPTCGSVPGTEGSYEYYMAYYIEGALAKGATPILISPTLSLKNNTNGVFTASYTNYLDSIKKLASYYNVPYIDLNGLMVNHYNSVGYDTAYTYHMCSTSDESTDMTHFTETGANVVAGLVANAIKGLGVDISSEVK